MFNLLQKSWQEPALTDRNEKRIFYVLIAIFGLAALAIPELVGSGRLALLDIAIGAIALIYGLVQLFLTRRGRRRTRRL
jgi:hypothetical protein